MTFHREGTATLIVALLFTAAVGFASYTWLPTWAFYILGLGCLVLLGLVVNFFRMPSYQTKQNETSQPKNVECPGR